MLEVKTGIDLCEIRRLSRMAENPRFLARILTPGEQAYLDGKGKVRLQSLAGLWAAKEAVLKALGTGLGLPMTDVEITWDAAGAPLCVLHGKAAETAGNGRVSVSITHDAGIAAASAVLLRDDPAFDRPQPEPDDPGLR